MSPASSTCPSCGGAVDPLRAPVARIVGGRVVTFCSSACADGRPAATGAEAAASTAAAPPVAAPAAASRTVPVRAALAERAKAAVPEPAAVSARAAGAVTERAAVAPAPAATPARAAVVAPGPAAKPARAATPAPAPAPAAEPSPAAPPVARGTGDLPAAPDAAAPAGADAAADAADVADTDDDVIELVARRRPARRRTSRRARVLALLAAIIAGGAAVVVLSTLVSPSRPTRVDAATDERAAPHPARAAEPAGPARPTGADLYAGAQQVLTDLLASPSHRVHRVAAEALSRTGNQAAIDWLAHALDTEPSAISRIEEAYALARAGDPRGRKVLVAGLGSPRRDVKGEAARRLLLLGDQAGAPFMNELMGLSQNRLGAAEILARSGDAKALAVLRGVVADAKAPREAHMRAVLALGRAGQPDAADELRAHLADPDWSVGAAQALAYLGDPTAATPLVTQLDASSLRVRAAVSLRHLADHLDHPLDRAVWIDHLGAAMGSSRDVDQASAAEAALILFGPPTLADHD